ncbi:MULTISPECIES: CHAT domain-containing protein [unclassified Sphingomonas]|uniref:CHAT domain-containing protein n=1 Tax=unclassified Sphingomonas TaxID=196159 RepID=UPI002150ACB4|nr:MULTISPECIES: CHAT domain-containing protein [unclassified Sphingomonas]MCR5870350.1 CHAT domain-containing protein [Sphingomonas sp. J344]UUY01315.1 CHAT domain-containing protein [Sphingomonas sp. J315]
MYNGGGSGRIEGPGVEYASYDGDEELDPVEVNRYPIVESSGEPSAGAVLDVTVDLTTDANGGERLINVGSFAADWTEIELSVQIVGDWLKAVTPLTGSITLRRDGPTTPATFTCTVSPDYVRGTPAVLQVYYLHGTRICGSTRRDLAAADAPRKATDAEEQAKPAQPKAPPAAASVVTVAPDASGPALVVMIAGVEGQQQWVWKTYGPDGYRTGSGTVQLGGTAKTFADTLLASCPDLPVESFRRTMRGIGETIWRKAPDGFRDAYLRCRQVLGGDFPIQFSSDDPHVPWEMMKPDIDGGKVDHLYIEHPVARWPLNTNGALRPTFLPGDILSFVPDYPVQKLASAAAESAWICSTLGAIRMDPTRDAFLDLLDGKHPRPVQMIHFAGHGMADTGSNDGGIELQDAPVGLMEVNQSSVQIGHRDGPLIVLNACEASAGAEMLGMNTGWGAMVPATGFGGLIAPLWAVQDAMAFQMAQDTLPQLVSGRVTLGAAVRDARWKNADASVAALAYLTHGDVMARFATS